VKPNHKQVEAEEGAGEFPDRPSES
jgi:hypothetical protein